MKEMKGKQIKQGSCLMNSYRRKTIKKDLDHLIGKEA